MKREVSDTVGVGTYVVMSHDNREGGSRFPRTQFYPIHFNCAKKALN